MFQRFIRMSAALLGCVLNASFQTPKPQHARLSLVSEHSTVVPGGSEWVGIRFELEAGWHVYWTNPGDSGEPPKITWSVPSGIQLGALQFPPPKRIADHGMTDYGYDGSVVLLSQLTISRNFPSNKGEISGDVRYLVCREVCVPGKDHLRLSLDVGGVVKNSMAADLIRETHKRLPEALPRGMQVHAVSQADDFVIAVEGLRPGIGALRDFIPSEAQVIENSARPKAQPGVDQARLTVKKSEQLSRPVSELRGLLLIGNKAYNVAIPVTSSNKNPSKSSVSTITKKN
jgi:thiol:disulfide interchange protein DsbD